MRRARGLVVVLIAVLLFVGALITTRLVREDASPAAASGAPTLAFLEAGRGDLTLVLLHGYGSAPEEWMPFTDVIVAHEPVRFVFPRGPYVLQTAPRRLGWWPLDLSPLTTLPYLAPVRSARMPPLSVAAGELRTLLAALRQQPGASSRVVVGGYSQGSLVAAEAVLAGGDEAAGLVLLSTTAVHRDAWLAAAQSRDVPIFMAHGRSDDILPFSVALSLKDDLVRLGSCVTWVPFSGGHEIPPTVVTALGEFLTKLATSSLGCSPMGMP